MIYSIGNGEIIIMIASTNTEYAGMVLAYRVDSSGQLAAFSDEFNQYHHLLSIEDKLVLPNTRNRVYELYCRLFNTTIVDEEDKMRARYAAIKSPYTILSALSREYYIDPIILTYIMSGYTDIYLMNIIKLAKQNIDINNITLFGDVIGLISNRKDAYSAYTEVNELLTNIPIAEIEEYVDTKPLRPYIYYMRMPVLDNFNILPVIPNSKVEIISSTTEKIMDNSTLWMINATLDYKTHEPKGKESSADYNIPASGEKLSDAEYERLLAIALKEEEGESDIEDPADYFNDSDSE